MRITNRLGLPASLVDAVAWSDRDREGCDYTVTELLEPPRIVALKRHFEATLEEDAGDRLWSLLGSAGHEVLARYGKQAQKAIVEERAVMEIDVDGKTFKVGGRLDYAITEEYTLIDFKFVSYWAAREVKPEWVQQLNLYRYLATQYGVKIEKAKIIAILRDWSVREARRDPSYPQVQCIVHEVPVWSLFECQEFMIERIRMHEEAKVTLPACSSADMWERPERWAAIKPGAKRATRVFDDQVDAVAFACGKGLKVERRPGERPRCESYCPCSGHCAQYQLWKEGQDL
jgi:hypothetical protein